MGKLATMNHMIITITTIIIIIIIIIIFNIYIAQINIQEDMIKCALHIKIESKITMLPLSILNLE